MEYTKRFMSITELVALGWSRSDLKQYVNAKGAPVIRTAGGGKCLFDTTKLDEWVTSRMRVRR